MNTKAETVCAPVRGTVSTVSRESDQNSVSVSMENGDIVSPVSGVIADIRNAGTEMTFCTDGGAEITMQIGIPRGKIYGDECVLYANTGKTIGIGERILQCDIRRIRMRGWDTRCILSHSRHGNGKNTVTAKKAGESVYAGRTPLMTIS